MILGITLTLKRLKMAKINSKDKGKKYEQKIRKELAEMFYPDCARASYVNKYADDFEKADIVGCGFLRPQLKSTSKAPNFQQVLSTMPDDDKINVIFHKRTNQGEVVIMSKEDFYGFLSMLKMNGIKI